MKRNISGFVLAITLVLLTFSCEEDKTNPIDILTSKFEAKIGSDDFVAATKFYNDNTGYLVITGQRLESGKVKDQIIITVPSLETGSYTIGFDNIVAMNYQNDSNVVYTGYSGTVDITKIEDNKINGLFNFQATSLSLNTIHISDGVFEKVPKVGNK